MIKVTQMTMKMISGPLFRVQKDDENEGVTLKYYEVEESGEYADCYHKTTKNCTFHLVCVWHHNVQEPQCADATKMYGIVFNM